MKQGKGDEEGPKVTCIMGPLREGNGWAVVFDLSRGGKTAADVLAKRTAIAAELGVDEIQVIMSRVRAHGGGHAGRVSMWVADDDPYLAPPVPSPLEGMDTFSIWDAVPFGQDARGNRVSVPVVWQSMFFGGLPRRGKTFTQRLLTAAGLPTPPTRPPASSRARSASGSAAAASPTTAVTTLTEPSSTCTNSSLM
ncbi:hypothetical protein ACFYWY_06485 [Streptomyces sp. NPDC002870]|uniref:hypothetical protein n=1 Tax=Streptomyces sp. NPDC002870 TaxID=3364666 RepID=UPI003697100B